MPTVISKLRYNAKPLPIELLDYIVHHVLLDSPTPFTAISAFSLVSRLFRELAFRQYFTVLSVTTKEQWFNMCRIPGMDRWVRELKCTNSALYTYPTNLRSFPFLTSATIDFEGTGRKIHHPSAKLILSHMPTHLTRLTLLHLPSITTYLLTMICGSCPSLASLMLCCSDRLNAECCWGCFVEAATDTVHSPVPDYVCNVEDLVNSYGRALTPLQKLKHFYLGIFLSPEDLLYAHLRHARTPSTVRDPPYGLDLCALCSEYADAVRATELVAAAGMAGYLPRLESVTWSTWFAGNEHGDDFRGGKTTVWVLRDGEDVVVRRKPW